MRTLFSGDACVAAKQCSHHGYSHHGYSHHGYSHHECSHHAIRPARGDPCVLLQILQELRVIRRVERDAMPAALESRGHAQRSFRRDVDRLGLEPSQHSSHPAARKPRQTYLGIARHRICMKQLRIDDEDFVAHRLELTRHTVDLWQPGVSHECNPHDDCWARQGANQRGRRSFMEGSPGPAAFGSAWYQYATEAISSVRG